MNEITLNAIFLQILRRKRLFALILLVPMLLGMGLGLWRGLESSGGPGPWAPGIQTDYHRLQYDAINSLYEAGLEDLENSLLLNLDPSQVHSRRHTFYLDDSAKAGASGELVQPSDEIGFYYAWYKFTQEDYSEFRSILGDPQLTESQIDELVAQAYNNDLNLLTLASIHPDPAIANALGQYNSERIMKIYEAQSDPNHELHLIGDLFLDRADESILTKLNEKTTILDNYKRKMDELRPALLVTSEPAASGSFNSLMASLVKWGLLGLMGGLALTLVAAAFLAARSDEIHDVDALLKRDLGAPFLGFLPGSSQLLAERLVFGQAEAQPVMDQLLMRLSIDQKKTDDGTLRVVGLGTDIKSLVRALQTGLPGMEIQGIDRLDPMSIRELEATDQVLLVGTPQTARKELRQTVELIRHSGASVSVVVQADQD